jgi:hypothetical protein
MNDSDDMDFEADVSPSVFGKPIGFLEPKNKSARAAQRARRRGDICPSPEELKSARGAVNGHGALRSGDEDWELPPTML